MKRSSLIPLIAIAAAASLAGDAPAQTKPLSTAAPAPIAFTLHVNQRDAPLSEEEVTRTVDPATGDVTWASRADVRRPDRMPVVLDAKLVVSKSGNWKSYRADATETGAPPQQVTAEQKGGTAHLSVGVGEKTQGADPKLDHDSFVLDNLVFSHYAAMFEALADRGTTSGHFSFVVPQVLQAIPGTVQQRDEETGTYAGKKIKVLKMDVQISNLVLTARQSADVPGRLLEVDIPIQHIAVQREGFIRGHKAVAEGPTLPAGLTEVELTIGAGTSWPLGATLTLPPPGATKAPAIVLVHGSGPQDRDETIGPNRPFRDFAWGLAAKGIAVLRYEKRTNVHGAKMKPADVTLDAETIDDAVAAANLLAKRAEIDPARIFVAGHSLGGFALPDILAKLPTAAGGILLAGASRPLDTLIDEQTAWLARANETPQNVVDAEAAKRREAFAAVRSGKTPDAESVMGAPASYWRDLFRRDPAPKLAKDPRPILSIRGAKDYQVRAADLDGWKKAATAAGKTNLESRTLAGLNHLFMPVEGVSDGVDYQRPNRVALAAIDAVADWIRATGGSNAK